MQLHHWIPFVVALTPSLASAALFPSDTVVKMLDAKDWKKVMKENVRILVHHPPLSLSLLGHGGVALA